MTNTEMLSTRTDLIVAYAQWTEALATARHAIVREAYVRAAGGHAKNVTSVDYNGRPGDDEVAAWPARGCGEGPGLFLTRHQLHMAARKLGLTLAYNAED